MADIKVREVNKGSIKTLDRSITASKRIRNAASEIREQVGRVQYGNESEHTVNEYTSSEMQRTMGQSAYIAKRAVVKSAPYTKSGTEKAVQAYGIKQAEKKVSTQRIKAAASKSQRISEGLDIKESVSKSNHRLRTIQSNAQRNYTIRRLQKGMTSKYNSISKAVRHNKGGTDGIARLAGMIATSTKNMITAIVAGGWAAIAVVICCVLFGAAFYFLEMQELKVIYL